MEKKTTLLKKLLEIQKAVVGLKKDAKGNNYEYVSGAKVIEHIKPIMNREGVLLSMEITNMENTRQDYKLRNGNEKSEILTNADFLFTWICVETGETLPCRWSANGQNDWDKGSGSAATYAERYFLLKFFHIATDEDDVDNPNRKKDDDTKPQPQQPKPPKNQQPSPKPKTKLTEAHKKEWQALNEKGSLFEKGKVSDVMIAYNNNIQAITKKGVTIAQVQEHYDLEPEVLEHYQMLAK